MKKIILFLIPIISVIFILGIFAVISQPIVTPVNVVETSFKPITGAYITVTRTNGDVENLGWFHNVFTNAGKEAVEQILANQVSYGNFTYIGLCNLTAGACTIAVADTVILNNFTSCGMAKTAGTVGNLGTGNWSIYNEFTSSCNNVQTNMTGLLNQTNGGTLLAEVAFTDVTLQTGDKLAINWTCTAT